VVERDPALLPGLTAGQWQGRARIAFAAATGLALVTLGALGFGWRPHPALLIVPGALVLAGFVTWIALGEFAVRRMRAEHDRGYSTTIDVAGMDLRDPRTGDLARAAGEAIADRPPESFVARMLRIPRGSLLDRPPRDSGSTPDSG